MLCYIIDDYGAGLEDSITILMFHNTSHKSREQQERFVIS